MRGANSAAANPRFESRLAHEDTLIILRALRTLQPITRSIVGLSALALALFLPLTAFAQDLLPPPPPPRSPPKEPSERFDPRFALETARIPAPHAEADVVKFAIRGEYQVRLRAFSDLALKRPGASPDSLGQTSHLQHWLRLTPHLVREKKLEVIVQADVPNGMVLGAEPRDVRDAEPLDEINPVRVDLRWAYATFRAPFGEVRAGLQSFHFGMGLVENNGNTPSLFGDYFGGSKLARVSFESGNESSKLRLLAATDLVLKDNHADIDDGDRALRATLGLRYQFSESNEIALVTIYRHQEDSRTRGDGQQLDRTLNSVLLDSAGRFATPIRGSSGFIFGEYEAAYRIGDGDFVRALASAADASDSQVRAFGAALRLGGALTRGRNKDRYGAFVAALEWGYASGDGSVRDEAEERFAFDTNHNVGLLLFDHVLRWKTARAARNASLGSDADGAEPVSTRGGISAATYINPTFVFRPRRNLDLKFGTVLAQATEDVVDVSDNTGRFNYDGGSSESRDLGLELDAGVEYRLTLDPGMGVELGAQGGVLFPGTAFLDASQRRLATQYLGMLRFGLQF